MKAIGVSLGLVLSVLASTPARANVVTANDAKAYEAILSDLMTATVDVSQAMKATVDSQAASCLRMIHDEALFVVSIGSATSDLITLAALMENKLDEHLTRSLLEKKLPVLLESITNSREIINAEMGMCSEAATANVKGQAILADFSRLESFVQPFQARLQATSN
jgi:hypothetical protein